MSAPAPRICFRSSSVPSYAIRLYSCISSIPVITILVRCDVCTLGTLGLWSCTPNFMHALAHIQAALSCAVVRRMKLKHRHASTTASVRVFGRLTNIVDYRNGDDTLSEDAEPPFPPTPTSFPSLVAICLLYTPPEPSRTCHWLSTPYQDSKSCETPFATTIPHPRYLACPSATLVTSPHSLHTFFPPASPHRASAMSGTAESLIEERVMQLQ